MELTSMKTISVEKSITVVPFLTLQISWGTGGCESHFSLRYILKATPDSEALQCKYKNIIVETEADTGMPRYTILPWRSNDSKPGGGLLLEARNFRERDSLKLQNFESLTTITMDDVSRSKTSSLSLALFVYEADLHFSMKR
ncbi:hypothetical protein L6452_19886 [Arctium lappa]|uniref:Uncharacterized protein n=2 Tax=Arctium lappa TaxID=4217 RepID=A0ACB9BBN9_ARCLA|nr:hypothetical protein L6452_19884 [Arctium lappa]KAI3719000.1 hypothetical protein L6452_19886 [Arctium lappa]